MHLKIVSSLTKKDIPSSIDKIEDFTFNGCSSLVGVKIPSSVLSVGKCISSEPIVLLL